jgi:heme-degrading monooxygenase HmoA
MPTVPWITVNPPTESEVQVMASRLEVNALHQVPGFFLASLSLLRQARNSPGALGVSLKAEILRRTFWTLSAWTDKDALSAYASSEPHKSTIARKRKVMRESTFSFWMTPAANLPIDWADAQRRLAAERDGS